MFYLILDVGQGQKFTTFLGTIILPLSLRNLSFNILVVDSGLFHPQGDTEEHPFSLDGTHQQYDAMKVYEPSPFGAQTFPRKIVLRITNNDLWPKIFHHIRFDNKEKFLIKNLDRVFLKTLNPFLKSIKKNKEEPRVNILKKYIRNQLGQSNIKKNHLSFIKFWEKVEKIN